MSATQRILQAILPRPLAASMERESRQWRIRCDRCGDDLGSLWEAGGVRWRASGSPRIAARCGCGNGWAKLVRERD